MAEATSKTSTKKPANKTAVARAKPAAKKPVVMASVKPAAKKPSVKPAVSSTKAVAAKPAPVKKPAAPQTPSIRPAAKLQSKAMVVSDEQRYRMIAEAAYYRAESNQFKSDPVRDWIEAESYIANLLSGNSK